MHACCDSVEYSGDETGGITAGITTSDVSSVNSGAPSAGVESGAAELDGGKMDVDETLGPAEDVMEIDTPAIVGLKKPDPKKNIIDVEKYGEDDDEASVNRYPRRVSKIRCGAAGD